jgi:2-hydroxycyclohexanecarboxyl-CoA dehydrogenase
MSEFWSSRYARQSAIIVGGAGGIGAAAAERLAAEGAMVGIVDRDARAVEALVRALHEKGHDAYGYAIDATDAVKVGDVLDHFEKCAEKIDILVNLAGFFEHVDFADLTLDLWRKYISVNLDVAFVTCHNVLPRMMAKGYGRIATVSSASIALGLPEYAGYIAGKSGVVGFTRVLARAGGAHGVTANTIMPGLIATSRSKEIYGQDWAPTEEATVAMQCIPRIGRPDAVAEGIAFICSRQASHITGQVLNIDGGLHFTN